MNKGIPVFSTNRDNNGGTETPNTAIEFNTDNGKISVTDSVGTVTSTNSINADTVKNGTQSINDMLNSKSDKSTTYTKIEVDASQDEQNTQINLKANQSTTYTKTEVDNLSKINRFRYEKTATTGNLFTIANGVTANILDNLSQTDLVASATIGTQPSLSLGILKFPSIAKQTNYTLEVRLIGTYGATSSTREFQINLDYGAGTISNISSSQITKISTSSAVIQDKGIYTTYTTGATDRFVVDGVKINVVNTSGTTLNITKVIILANGSN